MLGPDRGQCSANRQGTQISAKYSQALFSADNAKTIESVLFPNYIPTRISSKGHEATVTGEPQCGTAHENLQPN